MAHKGENIIIKRSEWEELKNFKERMGKAVDLELGSSGVLSEDLNNPCRESELKAMYEKLSRGQWADFVWNLKKAASSDSTKRSEEKDIRKRAENIIEWVLRKSQEDILKPVNELKAVLQPTEDEGDTKTLQYFDMAVQNLQKAIYHKKRGRSLQNTVGDIPDELHPLADDCYKVGCLMALHNPPILLDWECEQRPFPPIKTGPAGQNAQQPQRTIGKKGPADPYAQQPQRSSGVWGPAGQNAQQPQRTIGKKGPEDQNRNLYPQIDHETKGPADPYAQQPQRSSGVWGPAGQNAQQPQRTIGKKGPEDQNRNLYPQIDHETKGPADPYAQQPQRSSGVWGPAGQNAQQPQRTIGKKGPADPYAQQPQRSSGVWGPAGQNAQQPQRTIGKKGPADPYAQQPQRSSGVWKYLNLNRRPTGSNNEGAQEDRPGCIIL